MRRARAGDVEAAARCELALRCITRPTVEQRAGAVLQALFHADVRVLREVYVEE